MQYYLVEIYLGYKLIQMQYIIYDVKLSFPKWIYHLHLRKIKKMLALVPKKIDLMNKQFTVRQTNRLKYS